MEENKSKGGRPKNTPEENRLRKMEYARAFRKRRAEKKLEARMNG